MALAMEQAFLYCLHMTDTRNKATPKDSHYARLRRAHRDAKPDDPAENHVFLYGLHTVKAAMENPARKLVRLSVTRNALSRLDLNDEALSRCGVDLVEPKVLDRLSTEDTVHQGVVLEALPLKPKPLNALADTDLILVLDQVTDPHNVGAILRSAVAFNAGALVTTARHSPVESGVLAKAASGALEHIDHIKVRNLADALQTLAAQGFRTIGLDSAGPDILERTVSDGKIALVLGAEGKGLRQKTRETVASLARLDMPGAIRSLNVSNAAALSLYVARRHLAG
jgi:23S rRNA (guanosine2251-2'-O)-methyltransferase